MIAITEQGLLAQQIDLPANLTKEISVSQLVYQPELGLSRPSVGLERNSVETRDASSKSTLVLPDEPQPMEAFSASASPPSADSSTHRDPVPATRLAPIYHRYIEPGESAQRLTPGQQLIFGLVQPISPYFLLTIGAAAGYEQAVNGAPNYGSNIRAYGQRVGAAAARNASQSFFSYSVMAPVFHEDVRYYIMGNRRNAFIRAAYAASRAVVTRDVDDGHATPNYAEITGYAEAAGLTNAYYPPVNRTFGRTASSFGVSLGGLAVSNVVREFLPGLLRVAHLDKLE